MINKSRVLAGVFAPEFDGGLANRNLQEINSKPLIEHACLQLERSKLVDQILFATNSKKTQDFLSQKGYEFESRLVFDHSEAMVQFDKCAMKTLELRKGFDFLLMVDVGYPLRNESDIDAVLTLSDRYSGAPTVTIQDTRLAGKNLQYVDSNRVLSSVFSTGQAGDSSESERKIYEISFSACAASRKYLEMNGSFFGAQTRAYLVPDERALKIDNKTDLVFAQALMARRFGVASSNTGQATG